MLERFENVLFGKTIGVLTLVLLENDEIYEQLTVFKSANNSFKLIANKKEFKKSDVEKVDIVVSVYIINNQVFKVFGTKDSIDKSLFDKTLTNSFNMSWINFSDRIISNQINEDQFLKLKKIKDTYLKDHHFTTIGYLGLENLNQLKIVHTPKIYNLISQNGTFYIALDEDEYDLIGLNSLGIVASIFSQKILKTKVDFRNDANVLKSFAKRILSKMVPVILLIMILNYFYTDNLNNHMIESQYEISLMDNLIGDIRVSQEMKNEDLKYFNEISSSFNTQRAIIINDLIECHEPGITYLKIIVDPLKIKKNNDLVYKGFGEVWFETKKTDLIDTWEKRLNNKGKFSNVELIELKTDNKGVSKGNLLFKYE